MVCGSAAGWRSCPCSRPAWLAVSTVATWEPRSVVVEGSVGQLMHEAGQILSQACGRMVGSCRVGLAEGHPPSHLLLLDLAPCSNSCPALLTIPAPPSS